MATATKKKATAKAKKATAARKAKNAAKSAENAYLKPAKASVDLSYKPKISALNQEISRNRTQGSALLDRSKGYNDQVGAKDTEYQTKQEALGALLQSSTKATNAEALARIDADQAKNPTAAAATSGGDASASEQAGKMAGEYAALRGRSQAMGQAGEQRANENASTWNELSNSTHQARQQQGSETYNRLLTSLANNDIKLHQDKKALKSTKGDLVAKAVSDLKQQDFENTAASKALGYKYDDLATRAAIAKGAQDTSRANAKTSASARRDAANTSAAASRDNAATAANSRERAAAIKAAATRSSSKESQQSKTAKLTINNVYAEYKRLMGNPRKKNGKVVGHWNGVSVAAHIRSQGVTGVLLNAASDLYYGNGKLSATRIQQLRQAGVEIPREWLPKASRKKKK